MSRKRVVTIFGSSMIQPGSPAYELAERLGRSLAEAGYVICNGGYGGSMEAAARGARQAGGEVIGITTEAFSTRRTANPYLTAENRQPTLLSRIETLINTGDAYVILPGGIGTLAELFIVWNLLVMHCIPPKPVLLLGEQYPKLLQTLEQMSEVGPEQLKYLKVAGTVEEVLQRLATS